MRRKINGKCHHCITLQHLILHSMATNIGLKTIAWVISISLSLVCRFFSFFQTEFHIMDKYHFPLGFAQLLIDHGAYVNAKDSDNKTPFDIAYSEKSNVHKQYSKYWHASFKTLSLVKLQWSINFPQFCSERFVESQTAFRCHGMDSV